MKRYRIWLFLFSACLLTLSACTTGAATTPAPSASPSPAPATPSPTASPAGPVGSPSPSASESPSAPSTGYLEIDGQRAHQVVIPKPAGAAEYAVTASGVYRYTNNAWAKVSANDGAGPIVSDPTNSDILYRGDHPACAVGGEPVSFQKSTDGGKTWVTMPGGENNRPRIVNPTNPSIVYGDSCALTVSSDAGQTWEMVQPLPSFDVSSLALAGNKLYGVYTSEGGTSRLMVSDISDPAHPTGDTQLLEFWGGGTVTATADRLVVGEPHGVHISTDGGQNWTFSRSGLEEVTVSVDVLTQPIPQDEISTGFGIFSAAIHPTQADHLEAGTIRGLYQSQDDGQTWTQVPEIDTTKVRELAFASNGSQLYVTTDDGVFIINNP